MRIVIPSRRNVNRRRSRGTRITPRSHSNRRNMQPFACQADTEWLSKFTPPVRDFASAIIRVNGQLDHIPEHDREMVISLAVTVLLTAASPPDAATPLGKPGWGIAFGNIADELESDLSDLAYEERQAIASRAALLASIADN